MSDEKIHVLQPDLGVIIHDCDDVVGMQGHPVVDRIQGFVYFVNTIHTHNPHHQRRKTLWAPGAHEKYRFLVQARVISH